MQSIDRRNALRRIVSMGTLAVIGWASPSAAQVGGGLGGAGGAGGAGGNDNNDKNKKNRKTQAPRIPFESDGEARIRFDLNLTPVGEGARRLVIALMTYNEQAKRYVKAMELGTFDGALNRKTAAVALTKGKFALELYGTGFQYDIKVERGPAKSGESDKPDDSQYSVIAKKSGKV